MTNTPAPRAARPPVEGEDFYREGAYIIFTARYHLARGYCCGSGCRHCPYREQETKVRSQKSGDGSQN